MSTHTEVIHQYNRIMAELNSDDAVEDYDPEFAASAAIDGMFDAEPDWDERAGSEAVDRASWVMHYILFSEDHIASLAAFLLEVSQRTIATEEPTP